MNWKKLDDEIPTLQHSIDGRTILDNGHVVLASLFFTEQCVVGYLYTIWNNGNIVNQNLGSQLLSPKEAIDFCYPFEIKDEL